MFLRNKRIVGLLGLMVIGVTMATVAYISGNLLPQRKPGIGLETAQATMQPMVTKDTVVTLEYSYLCGDKENSKYVATPDLLGLGMNQLTQKFSRDDGWSVSGELPAGLVLQKEEWDVCPMHRNYRHLGTADGYLAIFEGPLGVDVTLLQKEDIKVDSLPKELQERLGKAGKFSEQSSDTQKQLRQNLEFTGDEQVNTFLDNLDEFREE